MNTLLTLGLGLFSAFFPHTDRPEFNKADSYTCAALAWTTPLAMGSDGHMHGVASVNCDVQATAGGGFPQLETYMVGKLKQQATHVNSGPNYGTLQNMPSQDYDFNMTLDFSGSQVDAHEVGTVATDEKAQFVTELKTLSISGSDYDSYVKGFDIGVNVAPVNASDAGKPAVGDHYNTTISVSMNIAKPWYAPTSVLQQKVRDAAEKAVTSYQSSLMSEISSNL